MLSNIPVYSSATVFCHSFYKYLCVVFTCTTYIKQSHCLLCKLQLSRSPRNGKNKMFLFFPDAVVLKSYKVIKYEIKFSFFLFFFFLAFIRFHLTRAGSFCIQFWYLLGPFSTWTTPLFARRLCTIYLKYILHRDVHVRSKNKENFVYLFLYTLLFLCPLSEFWQYFRQVKNQTIKKETNQ